MQAVRELEADLALISEPYRHITTNPWEKDSTLDYHLVLWQDPVSVVPCSRSVESGFVITKLSEIYLYSRYAPPNLTLAGFHEFPTSTNGRFEATLTCGNRRGLQLLRNRLGPGGDQCTRTINAGGNDHFGCDLAHQRVGNKKATGLNGIPNIALNVVIKSARALFFDVYNACIEKAKEVIDGARYKLGALSRCDTGHQKSFSICQRGLHHKSSRPYERSRIPPKDSIELFYG
ncbi:hypothetical protein J6590_101273 [Homalodisca vitripennis]|nr:hypothetical protein J6590_101273 [Homalodisca vitripennis]